MFFGTAFLHCLALVSAGMPTYGFARDALFVNFLAAHVANHEKSLKHVIGLRVHIHEIRFISAKAMITLAFWSRAAVCCVAVRSFRAPLGIGGGESPSVLSSGLVRLVDHGGALLLQYSEWDLVNCSLYCSRGIGGCTPGQESCRR